ncbi:MAG: hypothetical protein IT429_02460 [Gemmataceae bacterium]|nr:hypothetical protein [Gemmataceae bacterium]
MSTAWVPPRRGYHLRIFIVSLLLVVAALIGFLFGVRMEATVPATGVVHARDQQEVRAALAGVVEPGWYEGAVSRSAGPPLRLRVDGRGDGCTDPAAGKAQEVRAYKLTDGGSIEPGDLRFHKAQAGDEVWPGQPLAVVRADELELRLRQLEGRVRDLEDQGRPTNAARAERDALRALLAAGAVRVPQGHRRWAVFKVHVEARAAVRAGDPVALVAPLDPQTGAPLDPVVRLEVADRHRAEVEVKQTVRVYPAMYNQRLHGHAEALVERVEPWGEPGPGGERRFTAVATITRTPFPLRPGAGCRAEIVVGRKQVYRLILEQ